MLTLRQAIEQADKNRIAIGHFNVSDISALHAVADAAHELKLPVIIGVSEGEREFIGTREIGVLIRVLREELGVGIYLNADHTHSLEKIKEAVAAGFDAVLFDGSKLPLAENMRATREVVEYVKSVKPEILVEGEVGYIGGGSEILKELPADAAIRPEDLTRPEEAAKFVQATGVDLFAPAVGNVHGILMRIDADDPTRIHAENPRLDIERIAAIKQAAGVPLVLHGGSGITDEDFRAAIKAGISVIHISTELRAAWLKEVEEGLRDKPGEVAPYKIMAGAE
ncbi:MAG: class II fructose-bisphosphate aldolase, partial [Patescibacteria group bacterium]